MARLTVMTQTIQIVRVEAGSRIDFELVGNKRAGALLLLMNYQEQVGVNL
jgi:hypothetical protein